MDSLLITIAKQIRKWAEIDLKQHKNDCAWSHNLKDLCGICSYYLFKELKNNNIKNVVYCENDIHAFVKVKNLIIDVTATQFGNNYPTVFIIEEEKLIKKDKSWRWKINKKFNNIEKLNEHFLNSTWPLTQNPVIIKTIKRIEFKRGIDE